MAKLAPPKLQGALTNCSKAIRIYGCVPGARVLVFDENQTKVAETQNAQGDTIDLPVMVPLVPGMKLASKQDVPPNIGGEPSPFDRQVTEAFEPPAPPIPSYVVHRCARCVRVSGMTPGHTAVVRMNSQVIGSALAVEGVVDVMLASGAQGTIVFDASGCNQTTSKKPLPLPYLPAPPPEIGPPAVAEPLRECESRVAVSGLTPGAVVVLFRTNQPAITSCSPGKAGAFVIPPLTKGQKVWTTQYMAACGLERLKPGGFSNEVEVSGDPPPPPSLWPPCPGGEVMIGNLVKGAFVTLWRGSDSDDTYTRVAEGSTILLKGISPPLKPGEKVFATQALCQTNPSAESAVVAVEDHGDVLAPIAIPAPIYEGAVVIRVEGVPVGGVLTLSSKVGGGVIASVEPTMGPIVDLEPGPVPSLVNGSDEIAARFSICGKEVSVTRPVLALPNELAPPRITRAAVCGGFVTAVDIIPGSRVYLFVSGVCVMNIPSPRDEARIEYPLTANDVVRVCQQINGKTSPLSAPVTATGSANGEWYTSVTLDTLVVHAALLHDPTSPTRSRVVLFAGSQHDPRWHLLGRADKAAHTNDPQHAPPLWNSTRIYYPEEDVFTAQVGGGLPYDVFCAGHAFLGDGRLLVAGGSKNYFQEGGGLGHGGHYIGLRDSCVFNPDLLRWTEHRQMNLGPTNTPKSGGRWYPTLITLKDGSIMAFAGHGDVDDPHTNIMVERYADGKWEKTVPDFFGGRFRYRLNASLWYPRMFLLPSASQRIAVFGTGGEVYQGTKNAEALTDITWMSSGVPDGQLAYGPALAAPDYNFSADDRTAVMLPLLASDDYRARVLYACVFHKGKLSPFVFDFGTRSSPASSSFVEVSGMTYVDRKYGMATLLADGTIFVHGGIANNPLQETGNARTIGEIYNPRLGTWTLVFDSGIPRNYHSVSLLLSDGTVLVGGSNINRKYSLNQPIDETNANPDATDDKQWNVVPSREFRLQRFLPPYACIRPRPRITGVSTGDSIDYGSQFQVSTPDAASVARLTLLRHGSSTHAFDFDQRCIEPSFYRVGSSLLVVTAPPDGYVAPPGYYTLFLVAANGAVSSPGWVVRVGA